MSCYMCKYRYCWACGYNGNHLFHRAQVFGDGTGTLYQFFNWLNSFYKKHTYLSFSQPIVYPLIVVGLIVFAPAFFLSFISYLTFAFPIYHYSYFIMKLLSRGHGYWSLTISVKSLCSQSKLSSCKFYTAHSASSYCHQQLHQLFSQDFTIQY